MKAVVYDDLTLKHKGHPIQFRVGLGLEGSLVKGRIKGVDLNKLRKILEKANLKNRDTELFDSCGDYVGMETIAKKILGDSDWIDFVEIIENNNEKIILSRGDL